MGPIVAPQPAQDRVDVFLVVAGDGVKHGDFCAHRARLGMMMCADKHAIVALLAHHAREQIDRRLPEPGQVLQIAFQKIAQQTVESTAEPAAGAKMQAADFARCFGEL